MRSPVDIRRMIFGVVVVCAFGTAALGQPWSGSGTAEDPYQIWDACDMQAIGADSNYWDANFILCADVNLCEYTGTSFNIIGNGSEPFTGVFDGNGHTISNFDYNSPDTSYLGLFSYVDDPNAEIRNVGLISVHIAGTGGGPPGHSTGSLIGHLETGSVVGCWVVDCNVWSDSRWIGGLVGRNIAGYILDSNVAGDVFVTGDFPVGGLVGENQGSISNCYARGTINGNHSLGVLVGENQGSIFNCHATGNIKGDIKGGLVGMNYDGTISQCYSRGSVIIGDYSYYSGGLVGYNDGEVSSCYAEDNVVTGYDNIGGLVGYNSGIISNCHSDGLIEGDSDVGGLVGYNSGNISKCYSVCRVIKPDCIGGGIVGDGGGVTGCFWNMQTSGCCVYGSGYLTTAEMMTAEPFVDWGGWDFSTPIWTIDEGNDYPRLWWEEVASSGKYGGGRGLPADPYLIYIAEDIQTIGANPIDWNKHFKLMADIDLGGYTGSQFNLIGEYSGIEVCEGRVFIGVFDGGGHTISNFTYDCNELNGIGLFRHVYGSWAEIRDLGLVNPTVTSGGYIVGSLVGNLLEGNVVGCYVEGGSVSGGTHVGGLVGANIRGRIENSYSSASVFGEGYYVGGLVCIVGAGWMGPPPIPRITNCYSVGSVTGGSPVGGLVGTGDEGLYTKCFWDVNVNPDVNGIGDWDDPNVIGKTTVEMQTESTFTDAGWDFVGEVINGPNDVWTICEGTNYPKFVWQIPVGDFVCPDGVNFVDYAFFAEYWLQRIYGDCDGVELTGDGKVNWIDFDVFAEYWGQSNCGECGGADYTGEGDVDLVDLDVFSEHWLQTEYAEVDLTEDGQVGLDDLSQFAENWLTGL